jgi:hypothetical protein
MYRPGIDQMLGIFRIGGRGIARQSALCADHIERIGWR